LPLIGPARDIGNMASPWRGKPQTDVANARSCAALFSLSAVDFERPWRIGVNHRKFSTPPKRSQISDGPTPLLGRKALRSGKLSQPSRRNGRPRAGGRGK
jgi:hypothetical protein